MIIRKIEYVFLSLAIYSDHYPQNYAISYIGTDISQPEIHAHAQVRSLISKNTDRNSLSNLYLVLEYY